MRTRRSNRTKRYTVEKYDFEGSSDEEALDRASKHAERDENFDETAAAEESAEELALGQEHDENEDIESDGPVSEPDGVLDRFARQRVKPIRPFNVRAAGFTGYLDLEPVADGRIVRSYWGPYDRGFKGKQLVEAWYGRHEDGVKLVTGMLDRWMDWTVLPPKIQDDEGQKDRGVWSPNFFEREAYSAEHWYERVRESLPEANAMVPLSTEEVPRYQFKRESMPVLLGPPTSQQEVKFEPGDAYSISQNGLPMQNDDAPFGWILDAGGIVTGMDWAPLNNANSPQLLALCVIPHSDQELYDYEQESLNPEFQKYGTVQLWEFVGERQENGFARPSMQPPILRKTICLEFGRARRVKWSPACGFLAILCDDGNVYVVEAGDGGGGSYGKFSISLTSVQLLTVFRKGCAANSCVRLPRRRRQSDSSYMDQLQPAGAGLYGRFYCYLVPTSSSPPIATSCPPQYRSRPRLWLSSNAISRCLNPCRRNCQAT